MTKVTKQTLKTLGVLVTLQGCGGISSLVSGADASISATPNPVAVGQPVTVTWGGNKLTRAISNDFGAPTTVTSGTITDRTAVDVDYNYSAYGQNGSNPEIKLSARTSLTVIKSTKDIWVLGDPAVAGPNQVGDALRTITTGTVHVVDGRDPNLVVPITDVLVFHPSFFLPADGASHTQTLQKFSGEHRSVLIIGETSIGYFAGSSVANIGGYLGGATSFGQNALSTEKVRAGDGLVPLSIKYRGASITLPAGGGRGLIGVGGSADRIITTGTATQAFVYAVPGGGRFAFSMKDGVGSSTNDAYYLWAIRSMARWLMDM